MHLFEWKNSWRKSRSALKEVLRELCLDDIAEAESQNRSNCRIDIAIQSAFERFRIPLRSSFELCASDDNAWMWILCLLNEIDRDKANIAYMLPQRNDSVVRLSFDALGETPCYYSLKGTHTLSSLAVRLMRERACDIMVFSPAALDMKLLKLQAAAKRNEDAFDIAFGRAVMAIVRAADIYGIPVIFLRRMRHSNDSRGLSAVQCRLRVSSARERGVRILIEKDASAGRLSFKAPFPEYRDYVRQMELKYMLDI